MPGALPRRPRPKRYFGSNFDVRVPRPSSGRLPQIYQLWENYSRPRGYKLKVQIVNFPDGLPGHRHNPELGLITGD